MGMNKFPKKATILQLNKAKKLLENLMIYTDNNLLNNLNVSPDKETIKKRDYIKQLYIETNHHINEALEIVNHN